MFSCGSIGVNGAGNLDDTKVDGKFCAAGGVDSSLASISTVDTDCAPTANECSDLKDTIEDWANDICSEAHNYDPSDLGGTNDGTTAANLNALPAGDKDAGGNLNGKYCFNGSSAAYQWSGQVNGVEPLDDGDGDYSDPGEVPPPIMVFKGNLKMVGTPKFKGIIVVLGKYENDNDNAVGGNEDFGGSILSLDTININGNASLHYYDFSKYMNLNKNRVSRSQYYIADKPIRMKIGSPAVEYNVIIDNLEPPN